MPQKKCQREIKNQYLRNKDICNYMLTRKKQRFPSFSAYISTLCAKSSITTDSE